jgi:hypothetical protein
MDRNEIPRETSWYRRVADDALLKVIAIDEDGEAIDVQYENGDIDAISFDEWSGSDLQLVQSPKDPRQAFDDLDKDDLGYSQARSEGERRGMRQTAARSAARRSET